MFNNSIKEIRNKAWISLLTILLANALGGAIGAHIGSHIHYEGITIKGITFTDLRYGFAAIGGILGYLFFLRFISIITAHAGLFFTILVTILNVFALYYRLMENDFLIGFIGGTITLIPSIVIFSIAFFPEKY